MALSRALALEAARDMLDMSLAELWIDYVGLGGAMLPEDIQSFLRGERRIADHDHDVLVQALNERFLQGGDDHPLAYADELPADAR
jgi:hypothetical protein